MMIRCSIVAALGLALAACQPAIPDSGRGVGFDGSFDAAQSQRDTALAGGAVATMPAPATVDATPLDAVDDGSAAATAAETARILDATRPGVLGNDAATNSGVAPVNASPSNPAPPVLGAGGISQENNFDAVADERSKTGVGLPVTGKGSRYSLTYIDQFADRTLGIALGFVKSGSNSFQQQQGGWGDATVNATLANGSSAAGVKVPVWGNGLDFKNRHVTDNRKGAVAILSFKPNSSFSSKLCS